jgi:hypothetical protein
MATTQPPTNQSSENEIIGSQIKIPNKLSPLFGPNDFYYYNAQFPMGINFLGSVIGINLNDPEYEQYTNFYVNNPTINTTINGATYSIPYPLIKSKCNDPDNLLIDISDVSFLLKKPVNLVSSYRKEVKELNPNHKSDIKIIEKINIINKELINLK